MRALLLAILGVISATSPQTAITREQLIGHWRWFDSARSIDYVFRADGIFTGHAAEGDIVVAEFKGKWSVESGFLLYEYISDSSGHAPQGAKDRDQLLEVTKDYYVIRARTGAERKYMRVE